MSPVVICRLCALDRLINSRGLSLLCTLYFGQIVTGRRAALL